MRCSRERPPDQRESLWTASEVGSEHITSYCTAFECLQAILGSHQQWRDINLQPRENLVSRLTTASKSLTADRLSPCHRLNLLSFNGIPYYTSVVFDVQLSRLLPA